MNREITRRTVLRGLGAAIALPWLEIMATPAGLSAGTTTAAGWPASAQSPPVRTAFFYVPNGIHMPDWIPQEAEGRDFRLQPILQTIADFREKFNIVSGLSLRNADALGSGPGDHARSNAAFLTGAHPKKTNGAGIRNGVSIDQLIASQLGERTRMKSLELGLETSATAGDCDSGYSCAYTSNLSWRNDTSPVPKEINPAAVFERLFGSKEDLENQRMLAKKEARRKSILDFVNEEARALNRQLGVDDRRKLDEYLYAIRDIERRLVSSEKLDQVEVDLSNFTRPVGVPRQYEEHAILMMDMLVLAFQTDSTRIATFSFGNEGSNRAYRNLAIQGGHHEISHHGGATEKQQMISKINQFHMQLFRHFLGRLDQIEEGERTLLDNSMILYGCGIADGNSHSHHNLPILLAGRAGERIETGRYLKCPKGTPLTNLYCSMLQNLDIHVDSFADSNGVVEELV